jgi:hypothetical protein
MKSTRYTLGLAGGGADGDRLPPQPAMLPTRTSENRHLWSISVTIRVSSVFWISDVKKLRE